MKGLGDGRIAVVGMLVLPLFPKHYGGIRPENKKYFSMNHKYLLLVAFLFVWSFSACDRQPQEEIDEELIQSYLTDNNITASQTTNGVYYQISERGEGVVYPQANSTVLLNYSGKLLDGTIFDSSYERGEPNRFLLPELIDGFKEGALQFARGDKGQLIIPSRLAYGSQKVGAVPSHSVLVFELEILAVEDEEIADFVATQGWNATTSETGLRYVIELEGAVDKPSIDNAVKTNYTLSLLDGTVVQELNKPVEEVTPIPLAQTVLGWQEGIPLLGIGGKMKMVVPAALAYGSSGSGSVPASSVLVFEVELLDFE